MTSDDSAAEGRRRADEFLTLLAAEDPAADALLEELTEIRELVFLGAGLTAVARAEGRALPTAQRAQASTRQVNLGQLRDRNRADVAGLRTWLRRSGEEVLFIRSLHAAAARATG
ncbi:hypothetical protein JKP75_04760 [Blastococcus sp. TML/M2B]|uniref:hypothetical protein n=1 Tax=unclassified Blastococcus TaxID=2619396 RepID=UPI00190D35F3|nr:MULTISPECIES: hypothetical protein [unclassified Blastococcus]MBN1091947.1 hypothetical protein [Blastococcus sp. TML/M2B]MBN1097952.1 hypothetical protein [Blastococcus sp. TML/C7B]